MSADSLPSFHQPPVVEVAVGAKTRGADLYSLRTLGEFAAELASEGLSIEDSQPGILRPDEPADLVAASVTPPIEILLGTDVPPMRHLLQDSSGSELVQIQPDWLGVNWRKTDASMVYPRWPQRWLAFAQRAEIANRCFSSSGLEYDQVEVVYVNHIGQDDVWESHADVADVFSFFNPSRGYTDGFLDRPERTSTNLTFQMRHHNAEDMRGRLHVAITPAWSRADNRPIFNMTLAARGQPARSDIEGVRDFTYWARSWIVRAFADLTTGLMHKTWQRHKRRPEEQ